MSNYSPIVSYGPKDSLAHGDPNKALKGVQIDAELSAIATAIATKLDNPLLNIVVSGTANNYAATITGADVANQSFGLSVAGGSSASDNALVVTNPSFSPLFKVRGDGHLFAGIFDFTPSQATFTATYSGAIAGTANLGYIKMGPQVTLYVTVDSSQSVSTGAITVTSLPAAIRPTVSMQGITAVGISGGTQTGTYSLNSSGVLVIRNSIGGVLSSGAGLVVGTLLTYVVQ